MPLVASLLLAPLAFRVHIPEDGFPGSEKVTAVIYLSGKGGEEPRFGPDWLDPQPCFSARFTAKAGETLVVDAADAVGFPGKLSALEAGEYTVQAVVDRDLGGRAIGESPGNLYSKPIRLSIDPATSGPVELDCTEKVKEPALASTENVKQLAIPSALLTAWYKRPTTVKVTVALPKEYNGKRSFPAVYITQGFGSTFRDAMYVDMARKGTERDGKPFVNVVLDANCPTGHSVFADSANNGPWGTALTTEVIPALEKRFRLIAKPSARLLNGHSSGGWTSLWLQVCYPDFFGGTWSTSPDPVDFHDFQMIDLYKPGVNMFTDEAGQPRPIAREGGKPILYYKGFSDMERPIRGEQLGSFEAVFSPRDKNGQPMKLWDRDTGAVDAKVASEWRKYDIADKLKREWTTLGPKLKGKLHVYCGNEDTFYLDGAVRRLKAQLKGYDAKVELFPGNHFTVLTLTLWERVDREMAATVR